MPRYVTNREWAADKAALTRAKKKGAIDTVRTVATILRRWEDTDTAWPDDWAHLDRCLSDACGWPAPTVDDIRPLLHVSPFPADQLLPRHRF